ncbi:HET-domain-containing protein [Dendrothele bispora CBS 962.96]|uniref:HET-domain-containing protein n=1 Tax=Dendrothele bispora (strain CBS 962.96) TaxID=1314807 RepID=A0A4S8M6G2_DENBC|nr:HET-domain-containing protein [Dendrothele bispora CBS 962.96]
MPRFRLRRISSHKPEYSSRSEKVCPRRLIDTRTLKLVDLKENDPVPPYAILSHRWIQGQEVSEVCPRRLINTRTLKFVELKENDPVPPYAILSHRWIQGQEVSYQEFLDGDPLTKLKSGYLKIAAACRVARRDRISFIWVDTCCIDKGSHDDVARNIRSMYAYYQNAQVCYAYLVDTNLDDMWEKRFLHSEWFKRGWTLQELLAPKEVIFFDQSWVPVGTKRSLREMVSYVTNIPSAVLSGLGSVYDIDPLERMSWTIGRKTTKPPDRAYCLLGLLDVSIEPDYDETFRESMERLRKAFVDAHPQHREAFGSEEVSFLEILDQIYDKLRRTRNFTFTGSGMDRALKDTAGVYPSMAPYFEKLSEAQVTFEDFQKPLGKSEGKSGYDKIRAACQQALKDGLRYIWIDTCCIDRGDHEDVVRNIKSMYAYYQNAEVCYAYLADVTTSSFESSEWFYRGWTLQELLAPSYVVFFDQAWNRIGSKDELKNEIATVTTIPKDVLSGERPIHDVDPLARMTWAVGRETTKPQDQAYCLLGLLGVSIDPDYDEDVRMSFERLRTVFVETHPERGEVEAVEDFYSFLNDRYQSWMDSLKLVPKVRLVDSNSPVVQLPTLVFVGDHGPFLRSYVAILIGAQKHCEGSDRPRAQSLNGTEKMGAGKDHR